MTLDEYRKDWRYRFFEGFTGGTAILFIIILIVSAIFWPVGLAIFLIIYSFFIVLKSALHTIYTFYTFNNIYRLEKINWLELNSQMGQSPKEATKILTKIRDQYPDKMSWTQDWDGYINSYNSITGTKYQDPNNLFHIVFVPIVDESLVVMVESITRVYQSNIPLSKIWVVIAREKGAGTEYNEELEQKVTSLDWVSVVNCDKCPDSYKANFDKDKLQVFLTLHPDNLENEIRGKGSNLDWAGRQISKIADAHNLDDETSVITVLDCDSRPGRNFFQILAFRYVLTLDRQNVGFQPIPVFTNNYFEGTLLSSLVATGTTLWNFVQNSIPEEIHHFANYSVSLKLLRKTHFWVKDMVSEDSLFFKNNFCELDGNYRVVPTFAYFESDVVESKHFGTAIFNQYKQLRRWAYGGVEGMSYFGRRLILDPKGSNVDGRKKFMMMYNEWVGHFFWSTMPFVFGFVMFLPSIFNSNFDNTVIASNLSFFSQWFSLISYVFLLINGYIILHYIRSRLLYRDQKLKWNNYLDIILQVILSPLIFVLWFIPPIEAQIRGIFGKYLGFWVTPK
jgi:hypothetical protein